MAKQDLPILGPEGKTTVLVYVFPKYLNFRKLQGNLPEDVDIKRWYVATVSTVSEMEEAKKRVRNENHLEALFFGFKDLTTEKWFDGISMTTGKLCYAQSQ